MNENRVKRILREGGLALGTHVGGIADPQIVELIGLAGFPVAYYEAQRAVIDATHRAELEARAVEEARLTDERERGVHQEA